MNKQKVIRKLLTGKGAEGIRLNSVAGCCGPQFAISLDTPEEPDPIQTIHGIKVAFTSELTGTDELTLDKEEGQDGEGLVLVGASDCY